jgi:hypothetical protein
MHISQGFAQSPAAVIDVLTFLLASINSREIDPLSALTARLHNSCITPLWMARTQLIKKKLETRKFY